LAFFQNRRAWSVSKPAPRRISKAAHECFAHQRVQPRHASLIGGDRRSSSGSLVKFAAMRRASSRVSRFGRRAVRHSDMSESGRSGSARLALETTLMTVRPEGANYQ
jgi:hypothetical protein